LAMAPAIRSQPQWFSLAMRMISCSTWHRYAGRGQLTVLSAVLVF
jgi:hypothetical protein